ncbi:hypothetical protein [Microbacterium sp. MMO-10]|uniref:hypothetical protein n=1 Tax=Microbacterium sp. MMO-10 TaxID=3081272 RepID=UPI00301A64FA
MTTAPSAPRAASPAGETRPRRFPPVVLVPPGHSARIIDALLAMLLVYRLSVPGVPLPIPQLAAITLVAIGLFRTPTRSFSAASWYPVVAIALFGFLAVETLINDIDPLRRGLNIASLMLFAAFLATGRIDVGSVIKGLGVGLVLNAALFYLRLTPDDYQGRLTGFLQDKNAAALVYAVGAVLLAMVARKVLWRMLILAAGVAAVVATDSRTTMAAYAVAVVFLLLSGRMHRAVELLALTIGVFVFLWADDNLSKLGDYAVSREGSDAFRLRIDAASSLKAQGAPWYGDGLGTATVRLDSGTWFFHNSYEGLIVEGGIVLLVVMLAIYLVTGLGLSTRVQIDALSFQSRAITAATAIVCMCALRLGEVFFAPVGFLVLGIGLARLLAPVARKGEHFASASR